MFRIIKFGNDVNGLCHGAAYAGCEILELADEQN
jgi:hypothetical protein